MEHDEIPNLNEPLSDEIFYYDLSWQDFANSTNRLLIYTAPDGEPQIRFDKLGHDSYANMVAILSHPNSIKFVEHLKLGLEGARLVQAFNKKSFEKAIQVEKYIRDTQRRNKAEAERESSRLEVVERWEDDRPTEKGTASLSELRKGISGEIQDSKESSKETQRKPLDNTLF